MGRKWSDSNKEAEFRSRLASYVAPCMGLLPKALFVRNEEASTGVLGREVRGDGESGSIRAHSGSVLHYYPGLR